jgi:hypothetical protein
LVIDPLREETRRGQRRFIIHPDREYAGSGSIRILLMLNTNKKRIVYPIDADIAVSHH